MYDDERRTGRPGNGFDLFDVSILHGEINGETPIHIHTYVSRLRQRRNRNGANRAGSQWVTRNNYISKPRKPRESLTWKSAMQGDSQDYRIFSRSRTLRQIRSRYRCDEISMAALRSLLFVNS